MVEKTRMLRFRDQIYQKRKQYENKCFKQKAGLQKSKQIDETYIG